MRFLLKVAFWLCVVLVLLPSAGSEPKGKAAQVSTSDAMTVAAAAAADVRQFCDRRPETCTTGSHLAVAIGHRAQAGAKMLYEFLTDQLGEDAGPVTTASTPAPVTTVNTPAPAAKGQRDTLTPVDMQPEWRGPRPRPDRRA